MTPLLLSPHRWTLRARLIGTVVALLAVVCLVVGGAVTLALREFLYERLDKQVTDATSLTLGRYSDDGGRRGPQGDDAGTASTQLAFLNGPGLPAGTVGAHINGDAVTIGKVQPPIEQLPASLAPWFQGVPADGTVITRAIPGLGDYRLAAHRAPDGDTIVAGLPVQGLDDTITRLVLVELVVASSGLLIAGVVASVLIRRNLEPLQRVASTATRVSSLPLDRGDVVLHERVPDDDADPHTEVGQVTLSINRMLGHVARALAARHASETRVRQFVADASHELRTPLASIRGYAEFAQLHAGPLPPDAANALVRVRSQTERMADLVDDLLLLARLDSGRPLGRDDVDLSRLIVEAVGDAHVAGPDHVWLLDVPDEPVTVTGDAARLHQVLSNLLANARTHTPAGTRVTTALAVAPGPQAVLTVSDDGPGIPAALLPDVFDRFARGDDSRTRGAGSTGLGLAIVAAVVEAHGGSVAVSSEPGATTFTVRLPATDTAQDDHTAGTPLPSRVEA